MSGFIRNDGGRAAAGYKGHTGDCVARAVTIASGRPYQEVYDALANGMGSQRASRRTGRQRASARDGITTRRKWFKDYMASIGFRWVPTMAIGSGCKVHLTADELPSGRLVVSVSKHYTAMIDGVIHDTHDPRRETHCTEPYREPMPLGYWTHDLDEFHNEKLMHHIERRCVYGFWIHQPKPRKIAP
jgi:hypothetical protein